MKKKLKSVVGFIVILMVMFTVSGCLSLLLPRPEFPSDFLGTWQRVDKEYPHTLTIDSRTLKASNQNSYWILSSISGSVYRIISSSGYSDGNGTINLKLEDGNLEIIDAYDADKAHVWTKTENDWTGTWERVPNVH